MKKVVRLAALVLSVLLTSPAAVAQPAAVDGEVTVLGRLPGPPLWKVSTGDHVLWILPHLDLIPQDLPWDLTRLERLLSDSTEYIRRPVGARGITTAKDPLTLFRVIRLIRQVTHLPPGETLATVLPAALHARFTTLLARYGLRAEDYESLSPLAAKSELVKQVLKQENLGSMQPVMARIDKLVKRNRSMRSTDASQVVNRTLTFREMKVLLERQDAAKTGATSIACLEGHLALLEQELPTIRERAQSWAQGHAQALYFDPEARDRERSCLNASIPELAEEVESLEALRRDQWLAAAMAALRNNRSSVAVLGVNDILDPDGLVAQLRKRGYAVTLSAQQN